MQPAVFFLFLAGHNSLVPVQYASSSQELDEFAHLNEEGLFLAEGQLLSVPEQ